MNRGCSIWAVELIRRQIVSSHPEVERQINAVLIDFFLYDLAKEKEAQGAFIHPTNDPLRNERERRDSSLSPCCETKRLTL